MPLFSLLYIFGARLQNCEKRMSTSLFLSVRPSICLFFFITHESFILSVFWVFENRVFRRIFGPKSDKETGEWRRLHNESVLLTQYCSGDKIEKN